MERKRVVLYPRHNAVVEYLSPAVRVPGIADGGGASKMLLKCFTQGQKRWKGLTLGQIVNTSLGRSPGFEALGSPLLQWVGLCPPPPIPNISTFPYPSPPLQITGWQLILATLAEGFSGPSSESHIHQC